MPQIQLSDIHFSYKRKQEETVVLDGLSASFESGKIHVILGKSGSGKTTLLRCVAGLCDYQGHILFDDVPIDEVPTQQRKVGLVSQEFALYPHFDLFKSISYPLRYSGANPDEIRERVYKIAEEFGIREILSRKPGQISIGQAQRAALARALVKRPDVCLLDEPLSNVDEEKRSEIRIYLRNAMRRYGITVIYVTHDLKEATAMGDDISLLDEGKIIAQGKPKEMLYSKNPKVQEFFESIKHEQV